jgi:hypothetical protein
MTAPDTAKPRNNRNGTSVWGGLFLVRNQLKRQRTPASQTSPSQMPTMVTGVDP